MIKYILIGVYVICAIVFYKISEGGAEEAKNKYDPASTHMGHHAWNVMCDLIFICYNLLWPILLLRIIFSRKHKKE